MGYHDRLDAGIGLEGSGHGIGVGGLAPFEVERDDLGAEGPGDVRPAVAENADGYGEDFVPRGKHVDGGGLEAARTGAGQYVEVVLGLEDLLHLLGDVLEHLVVLRPAVVDHGAGHGLQDLGGQGVGPGMRSCAMLVSLSILFYPYL